MTLILRRTWPDDPQRPDFQAYDEGVAVGRMYETIVPGGGGTQWFWGVYGIATHGHPPSGRAADLEGAKQGFRAAWEGCQRHDELWTKRRKPSQDSKNKP